MSDNGNPQLWSRTFPNGSERILGVEATSEGQHVVDGEVLEYLLWRAGFKPVGG